MIRKDIRNLKTVQVTEAPSHIALWMACGQAGGNGAAVAELAVEEEEQEIAFAETNSTVDVYVKAKTMNLNSVRQGAVLWMAAGAHLVAGVRAADLAVEVCNIKDDIVFSLKMQAEIAMDNKVEADNAIHMLVKVKLVGLNASMDFILLHAGRVMIQMS